ncbi:MAG: hypothetical protein ACFFDX_16390 [Candidatus Odinarchaeota archaeon]
MRVFEKRKIIKHISLLEKELIDLRKKLYHIYDGIEILLNNMEEITKERFDSQINYIENNMQMTLFGKREDIWYFKQVLKGIGISKWSIMAYLHGYLNTFKFEQHENNLVNKLNDYDRKLKLLTNEPFEYKCVKCSEKIKIEYKETRISCPLCSSEMWILPSYDTFYGRNFNGKLSDKAKYSLLNINWIKGKGSE